MNTKQQTKVIFGHEYTLDDVDWCCQVGYPCEYGRLNYGMMTMGLWNGSERAMREMREYMESHNFTKLEDAGQVYCNIMEYIFDFDKDFNNVTDARLMYEAALGLPYKSEYDPTYRDRLVERFRKYDKIVRSEVRRMKRQQVRMAA